MTDSEIKIKFVVVGMLKQQLVQTKLCSTFDEAVDVAMGIVKRYRTCVTGARELLIEYKACYTFDFSIHIGEL